MPSAPEESRPASTGHPVEVADSEESGPVGGIPPNPTADRHWTALLLLRAAHLRLGLLTALALTLAAGLSGRPLREMALVFGTVLVGQCVLGWHNDLVDAERDHRHDIPGKPVAQGLLDPGTVWFAIGVGVLALIPLAVANGLQAATWFLVSVVVGLLGNVALRRGWLSWLPWAVSWALYVPFLSHGGFGGQARGSDPDLRLVALSAAVGIGVHVLTSLPGLLPDHKEGVRSLPLLLALRIGAPRLFWIGCGYLALLAVAMLVVAHRISQGG
jgi:4-hydroxybenzoate polyprenyltransferase